MYIKNFFNVSLVGLLLLLLNGCGDSPDAAPANTTLFAPGAAAAEGDGDEPAPSVPGEPVKCDTRGFSFALTANIGFGGRIGCDTAGRCESPPDQQLEYHFGTAFIGPDDGSHEIGEADETSKCNLVKSLLERKYMWYRGLPKTELPGNTPRPQVGDKIRFLFSFRVDLWRGELESFAAENLDALQGLALTITRSGCTFWYLNTWEAAEGRVGRVMPHENAVASVTCEPPFYVDVSENFFWRAGFGYAFPGEQVCRPSGDYYLCRGFAVRAPDEQRCTLHLKNIKVFDGDGRPVMAELKGSMSRAAKPSAEPADYVLHDIELGVW